jgi:tetratricopeptide (TPR) repeat protein
MGDMADLSTAKDLLTQALAAQQLGEFSSAERALREALRHTAEPEPVGARLMGLLRAQGKFVQARRVAHQLLFDKPGSVSAWASLALCELECGDPMQALACAQRACQLGPAVAAAHGALGGVLMALGRNEEALAAYDNAARLDPAGAEWLSGRAAVLYVQGYLDAAATACAQALKISPDSAAAHWTAALIDLTLGRFRSGWERFEWRAFIAGESEPSHYTGEAQRWRGEAVAEKRIVLWAEQGLGDVLQFCRFALLLRERGATVILQVPETLAEIVQTLDAGIMVVAEDRQLPPHELQAPLLSVPHLLQSEQIPSLNAYLRVPARRHKPWHTHAEWATQLRVGLMWQGGQNGARGQRGQHRSIAVTDLAPLLLLPCEFVALANEISESDRAILTQFHNFREYAPEIHILADTANLIDTLDLVVSIDTSVAHLAAALGKPTWVLLSRNADWRWGRGEKVAPWYPTCTRLYRQQSAGNWESVIGDVILALGDIIRNRAGG